MALIEKNISIILEIPRTIILSYLSYKGVNNLYSNHSDDINKNYESMYKLNKIFIGTQIQDIIRGLIEKNNYDTYIHHIPCICASIIYHNLCKYALLHDYNLFKDVQKAFYTLLSCEIVVPLFSFWKILKQFNIKNRKIRYSTLFALIPLILFRSYTKKNLIVYLHQKYNNDNDNDIANKLKKITIIVCIILLGLDAKWLCWCLLKMKF